MPSYAVIGASRGIGYAFLQHLSKDPQNIVVGTARSTGPTIDKVNNDGLKNVTIIAADLTDRKSLQGAAAEVSKLTGGSLDYLILNGAWVHEGNSHRFLDDFEKDPEALDQDLTRAWQTNVVGVIDAINAFVPLVRKGSVKKVVGISSGMADLDLIAKHDVWEDSIYSISKVALNGVMAKYAARYGRVEGILFLSLAPGLVDVGAAGLPEGSELPVKFAKIAPDFRGPITPAESVKMCLDVVEKASVENGDGGAFLSQHGDKNWL